MTTVKISIEGIILSPLKIINVPEGDVLFGMKTGDSGYEGFGEAYFSTIEPGAVKAWKRHRKMTLNLVVPVGAIRFIMFDDRPHSTTCGELQEVVLSRDHYYRLTIPPMVWLGFQGVGETVGMLLNIASIPHDPSEADRKSVNEITFAWQ